VGVAPPALPNVQPTWRLPTQRELRDVSRLALPIVVVQVGLMFMGIVDVLMVGRVSAEAIAAIALGNFVWVLVAFFGQGVIMVLDPLVAQAVGANDAPALRLALQRGLLLVAAVSVLSAVLLWPAEWMLTLARQPRDVVPTAAEYVRLVIPSAPAFFLFVACRQTLQALRRLAPVVTAVVAANVVNLVLDWALVFGHLGLPALGALGTAWATTICRWLMLLVVLVVAGRELARRTLPWDRAATRWSELWGMIRLGAPIGFQLFLEVAGFGCAMLLVGLLGTVPLAAHNLTLQLAALTYMVPLGVSAAAAVLVGRAIGARDEDAARREAAAALVIGVGFIILTAITFMAGSPWLARAFTHDTAVVALATVLIRIAGAFQLFDGAQVVATGILRGAADTRVPMQINFVGYLIVGLPIGALLCFPLGMGAAGIWWGLVLGLAVAALLLTLRVKRQLGGGVARVQL
jgi:multidrug resistance protein, MATE family